MSSFFSFTKKLQSLPKVEKNCAKHFFNGKSAPKMLVNLTPGLNFINVLCTAFAHVDPECAKKDSQVSIVILRFWALQAQKL